MRHIFLRAAAGLLVAAILCLPVSAAEEGIDISHYDGSVNFSSVKASGRTFAYIKATEGESWSDSYFSVNSRAASSVGVAWGPYHFFRAYSVSSAKAQAEHFWQTIKGTGYTLKPVVDVETADGQQLASTVREILQAFCGRFEQLSGEKPVIYSYTSYITEYGLASQFSGYLLWQADYRGYLGSTGWDAAVWQYSSNGSVSGVTAPSVDLDRLYDTSVYEGGSTSSSVSSASSTSSTSYTADWYPVGSLPCAVTSYAKTAITVRDSSGNTLGGHSISSGDPFIILNASDGLAEVLYPVSSLGAWFHGYIRSVSSEYHSVGWDGWHNGSTNEAVYNAAGTRIGTIYPYEYVTKLGMSGSRTHVLYTTSAGVETKTGYVDYKGAS